MRTAARRVRRLLYWGLPPVILLILLQQVDVSRLVTVAAGADASVVAFGVSLIAFRVVAGGLRWHYLTGSYECTGLTMPQSLAHYWSSLAMGAVTPGSLGSDAYRIALGGRRTGRYGRGAFVIVLEKSVSLGACLALLGAVYPFVTLGAIPSVLALAIDAVHAAIAVGVLLLAALLMVRRREWFAAAVDGLAAVVGRLASAAGTAAPTEQADATPSALLRSALEPRILLPAIAFSLAIMIVGALQGQVFLRALGQDLPFLANVFIAPLVMIAMTLPISVAGLGVREGLYVLCYGAFGVPAEIALLVSFLFLCSLSASYAIGVLLMFGQRSPRRSRGRTR